MLEQIDIQKTFIHFRKHFLVWYWTFVNKTEFQKFRGQNDSASTLKFHFSLIVRDPPVLIKHEIKGKYENILCNRDHSFVSIPTKLFTVNKLRHTYYISNEKKNCVLETQNIKRQENLKFLFTDFSGNDNKIALIPLFSTNNQ